MSTAVSTAASAMPPNCLWTPVFQGVDTQKNNLTRQVITMEERRGKRAAQEQVPKQQYDRLMRGIPAGGRTPDIDPWAPKPESQRTGPGGRHTIQPPVQGYTGSVPRGAGRHPPRLCPAQRRTRGRRAYQPMA